MIRRTDDLLALGAIAAGGAAALLLTTGLLAVWPGSAHPDAPMAPAAPEAPSVPSPPAALPAPPDLPPPPEAPRWQRFRPPVDHAPIPDVEREGGRVLVAVIPDLQAETPGAIRFSVISATAGPSTPVADAAERPGEPAGARRPPGGP